MKRDRRYLPLRQIVIILLCNILLSDAVQAQPVVARHVNGPPGKDIQIAVYLNVQPDCSPGPLPIVALRTEPSHGNVVVKKANVTATNYKKCLAVQVPASSWRSIDRSRTFLVMIP